MKKLFLILFPCLLMLSCTSSFKYDYYNENTELLLKDKRVVITVSKDAYSAQNSGEHVSTVIKNQLKPYTRKVLIVSKKHYLDDFTDEDLKNVDYVIIPELYKWEDHATFWSGIPDKIEFSIEIYDPERNLLKSAQIKGKSTAFAMGTNDPSELFEKPVKEILKKFFGEPN